eukprot:4003048-Prymnesium_polylepis.1
MGAGDPVRGAVLAWRGRQQEGAGRNAQPQEWVGHVGCKGAGESSAARACRGENVGHGVQDRG